jgi:hypothetical protein
MRASSTNAGDKLPPYGGPLGREMICINFLAVFSVTLRAALAPGTSGGRIDVRF